MSVETRKRFYNAIALTDVVMLTLQKSDFEHAVREIEKKFVNERIVFLKTIPEFNINITRSKLQNLCKHFTSVSLIKN